MRSICVSTSSNNIMATRMSDLDVNLDLTDNDSTGIEVEEEDEHSEAHSSRDDEPGPSKKAKTSVSVISDTSLRSGRLCTVVIPIMIIPTKYSFIYLGYPC